MTKAKENTLYLAGGCFWGLEKLFKTQVGVVDTEVGYMGGSASKPTYDSHAGHAEALRIVFDPSTTSRQALLEYFFRVHNPTTLNQQGNDRGTSYRSAVFYQSEDEHKLAEQVIDMVNLSGKWSDPVVTTLEPFVEFFSAEDYHQDYLDKHPGGYTCHLEYFNSYQ